MARQESVWGTVLALVSTGVDPAPGSPGVPATEPIVVRELVSPFAFVAVAVLAVLLTLAVRYAIDHRGRRSGPPGPTE